MLISATRLQRNFSRAAAVYDARAELQHVQTRRVLDAARMLLPARAVMADIGCGTGYFAAAARETHPDWRIIGIDLAQGMCAVASRRCVAINADAVALPLADASMDAVVSSLCYQWVEDQVAAFAELARMLKPGGRAIIASLGAATLQELRGCAEAVQLPLNLLPMRAFEDVRASLETAGLEVTLADARRETRYYPSVNSLMESMRAIGAGNNFAGGASRFIAPKRWAAMLAQYERLRCAEGIPATWEHHFFILHKPA